MPPRPWPASRLPVARSARLSRGRNQLLKSGWILSSLRNNASQVVHCFVIPRSEFKKLPAEKIIRSTQMIDGLETAAWSDEELVYLLIGSEEGVKVRAPELVEE